MALEASEAVLEDLTSQLQSTGKDAASGDFPWENLGNPRFFVEVFTGTSSTNEGFSSHVR